METVLFAPMGNRNVQMETHVVNFPQDNGVAVLFQMRSAAVMEFIVVQMGTLAMFLREPVLKKAQLYLC